MLALFAMFAMTMISIPDTTPMAGKLRKILIGPCGLVTKA